MQEEVRQEGGRRVTALARLRSSRLGRLCRALVCEVRGQATVEYAAISVALLGGLTLSWPFLIRLLTNLNIYYQGIFMGIRCPLP